MKISELMEKLGELQGKYGDIEVQIADKSERSEGPLEINGINDLYLKDIPPIVVLDHDGEMGDDDY